MYGMDVKDFVYMRECGYYISLGARPNEGNYCETS